MVNINYYYKTQNHQNKGFIEKNNTTNFQQSVSLEFIKFIQYYFKLIQKSQKLEDLFMFVQFHKKLFPHLVIHYSKNFIKYFNQ